jgi:hypothetical protein
LRDIFPSLQVTRFCSLQHPDLPPRLLKELLVAPEASTFFPHPSHLISPSSSTLRVPTETMTSPTKANGKAKRTAKNQLFFATSTSTGNRLGLPQLRLGEELPQTESEKEWPEWSQIAGITGARTRLMVDDWDGQRSKWTVRYVSFSLIVRINADRVDYYSLTRE